MLLDSENPTKQDLKFKINQKILVQFEIPNQQSCIDHNELLGSDVIFPPTL